MSSIYSHHRFGQQLVERLPMAYKVLAIRFEPYYLFGQQGPDLFFYHLPLSKKEQEPGALIHSNTGKQFIDQSRQYLHYVAHESPQKAYMLGALCHFILDSTIHPTVNALVDATTSHFDVEAEQDRYNMILDGKNPLTFRLDRLLPSAKEVSGDIFPIYRSYRYVEERTIYESILWYKAIKRIFYAPSENKEKFLHTILDKIGKGEYKGHIISHIKHPRYEEINEALREKFDEALEKAPELIERAFHYIYREEPLPEAFQYDYNGIYKGE